MGNKNNTYKTNSKEISVRTRDTWITISSIPEDTDDFLTILTVKPIIYTKRNGEMVKSDRLILEKTNVHYTSMIKRIKPGATLYIQYYRYSRMFHQYLVLKKIQHRKKIALTLNYKDHIDNTFQRNMMWAGIAYNVVYDGYTDMGHKLVLLKDKHLRLERGNEYYVTAIGCFEEHTYMIKKVRKEYDFDEFPQSEY